MLITNQTTIKDVEGCPFIGIVNEPIFMHFELDEVTIYDPTSFDGHKKVVMNSKAIEAKLFKGNYRNLVEETKSKGCMVYFYPTIDGRIVHRDLIGEYVRMAQVKLPNYHFNKKLSESVRNLNKPEVVKTSQKYYKYLLIRR